MKRTIYAHVKATPKKFPDLVTLQYRCANADNTFTGKAYEVELPWDQIRKSFFIREDDFNEREEYLKAGDAANLGFHSISVDIDEEESDIHSDTTGGLKPNQ
jgi:hypothetical protein